MKWRVAKLILKEVIIATLFVAVIYFSFSLGIKIYLHTDTPIMVVVSGSMIPTINVNDIIIVKGVNPQTLKVGDIIVFHDPRFKIGSLCGDGHCIVHRIVEVIRDEVPKFKTKGDANMMQDPFIVDSNHVIGKVILVIPEIGIIARIFKPPYNYLFVVTILIVFILYEASEFFKASYEESY